FDEQDVAGGVEKGEAAPELGPVDGPRNAGLLGRDGGGERGGEADGVDDVQRLAAIGEVGEGLGVFVDQALAFPPATRGERLPDPYARTRGLMAERGGDGAG